MEKFEVGEEVVYDGEVFVVSARSATPPFRYRLLASRSDGTRFVWAEEEQVTRMDRYLTAVDDTPEL